VIRRLTIMLVALGGLFLAPMGAIADERAPASPRWTVSLDLATTGMAEVRQPFRINVTPVPKAEGVVFALQVKSREGYLNQQRLALDSRGRASGHVVSKRAAERTYRAVLLSARGRVLASSMPVTVTWAPLEHSVSLTCTRSSAPVGVDVPCTVTVSPAVKLDRMIASLQGMGRTDWVPIEALKVTPRGLITTDVKGLAEGVTTYRALLLRDAKVLSESAIISIAYSAP
jgi:hypothetical protein